MKRLFRFLGLFFFDRSPGGGTAVALQVPVWEPLPGEAPIQTRDRLRIELENRGVNWTPLVMDNGDCQNQVATQLVAYEQKLRELS